MYLDQISVFLENKPGKLSEFITLLADNKIDLKALSIAETQDYGVLRIIVDNPDKTAALLKERNWPCNKTKVLAVTVPNEPGALTNMLAIIAEANISIAYTYAFTLPEKNSACIVLRVSDNEAVINLLKKNGIEA